MKIIEIPTNELVFLGPDGKASGSENYFWHMLHRIIGARVQQSSGVEVLDVLDFWQEIKPQVDSKELRIEREADYKRLLRWFEEHRGWTGNNPVELVAAVLNAVRSAKDVPKTQAPKSPKS